MPRIRPTFSPQNSSIDKLYAVGTVDRRLGIGDKVGPGVATKGRQGALGFVLNMSVYTGQSDMAERGNLPANLLPILTEVQELGVLGVPLCFEI